MAEPGNTRRVTRPVRLPAMLLLGICSLYSLSQLHAATGGIQAKFSVTLGTQDAIARVGLFAFTAIPGEVSLEAGAGVWVYRYIQRYGATETDWGSGYEAFGLLGAGDNRNLLGSTVSLHHAGAFYRPRQDSNFAGLGFGVSRDTPQGTLRKFGVRRGHAILRFASHEHSWHINFANDLRAPFFPGAAKDQGPTGSIRMGYATMDTDRLRRYAVGFDVFTPQPDYTKAPSNPQNSDDGAKRVWYNTDPWADLFHANLYVALAQQKNNSAWAMQVGVDTPAIGAYVQNRIHDSFGLYPRYPWPVDKVATPYLQATVTAGDLR